MNRLVLLFLVGLLVISGCTVRTYKAIKERVDQDLVSGNRGYLMGKPVIPEKERKKTRTIHVTEIELGPPAKVNISPSSAPAVSLPQEPLVPEKEPSPSIDISLKEEKTSYQRLEKYKVKKGDTLQKISQKFYGTSKKWKKIYQANKDILKSADKIYPGQEIFIPLEEGKYLPSENLK